MSKVLNMSGGGGAQEMPTITVSSSGLITAQAGDAIATKQLSSADDTDFIPGNILSGCNLFGIDGMYPRENAITSSDKYGYGSQFFNARCEATEFNSDGTASDMGHGALVCVDFSPYDQPSGVTSVTSPSGIIVLAYSETKYLIVSLSDIFFQEEGDLFTSKAPNHGANCIRGMMVYRNGSTNIVIPIENHYVYAAGESSNFTVCWSYSPANAGLSVSTMNNFVSEAPYIYAALHFFYEE